MKLRLGQKISGVYGGKSFTGKVAGLRLVDNYGRAAERGEALIDIDDPKTLVGVFGDFGPEGRDHLYLTTSTTFELEDSRIDEIERAS